MVIDAECRQLDRKLRWRGAGVMALFALVWTAAGASGITAGPGVPVVRFIAILLTLGALGTALGVRRGWPANDRKRILPDGWNRRIGLVNVLQLVAFAGIAGVLSMVDRWELLPVLFCFVVGLHFFPLARYYDQWQYTWTGSSLCVAAMAGAVAVGTDAAPELVRAVVGFGAAAVLYATSFHVALRG